MIKATRSEGMQLIVCKTDLARAILTIAPYMSGYDLDDFDVQHKPEGVELILFYNKQLPLI